MEAHSALPVALAGHASAKQHSKANAAIPIRFIRSLRYPKVTIRIHRYYRRCAAPLVWDS
jgi:hypothetical protein